MRSALIAAAVPFLMLLSASTPQDPVRAQDGPVQPPDLVAALRQVEGCLGVDAGRMQSGKQCIFAWFENKQAVLRWYRSKTHRGVMRELASGGDYKEPLAHIADDSGPIMVIASLTRAEKPHFEGIKMPVSQIAIELYQPLPGGSFLGERFTPKAVPVPHSRDYVNEAAETDRQESEGTGKIR